MFSLIRNRASLCPDQPCTSKSTSVPHVSVFIHWVIALQVSLDNLNEDMQIQLALHQSLLDVHAAPSQHLHSQDRLQAPGIQKLGSHSSSHAATSPPPPSVMSDFRLAAFRHSTQSGLATADHDVPSGLNAAGATAATAAGSIPVLSEFHRDALTAQASPDMLGLYEQALLHAFKDPLTQSGFRALQPAEKLTKEEVQ